LTHHDSQITCIRNIKDTFIVAGSRTGMVHVYRISNSELVASKKLHNDVVTCMCVLTKGLQEDDFIVITGGAKLDNKLSFWKPFRKGGEEEPNTLKLH